MAEEMAAMPISLLLILVFLNSMALLFPDILVLSCLLTLLPINKVPMSSIMVII